MMPLDDGLCRTCGAAPQADSRPPAWRRVFGERPGCAPEAEPARRLEASARAARRRAGGGPPGRAPPLVWPARGAARRGGRMARALPRLLDRPSGCTRTTSGGEPAMTVSLERVGDRAALRFERRLDHSAE